MQRVKFERDTDWEVRVGFNSGIDYLAIVKEYNSLVVARDKDGITKLLSDQGGLIELVAKAQYQKGLLSGWEIIREYPQTAQIRPINHINE